MIPARLVDDDTLPPSPEVLPPPWPGREVDVDGVTLYVRDTRATAPGAEPALYVHGLGGSSQNWTDLAGLLSGRLDGQAIDLPGSGRSGPAPRSGYTQAAFAALVGRWIEQAGRGPVHLVGNSLGGAVVARLAATRPELVRTLTLVSPAMPVLRPGPAHRRMLPVLVVPRVERLVERVVRQVTPEQMVQGVLENCFGDPNRVSAQRRDEAVREAAYRLDLPWAAEAYVRSLRGLVYSYLRPGNLSLWSLVRRIAAPTLVVWGSRDRLVNVRLAPRTARAIPDSRLLILEGVGHTAQLEMPRILARALAGLLEDVSGGRGSAGRDRRGAVGPRGAVGTEEAS
ncbi:MAG TPA: alpha/beta fold hydrolase [Cryptosporangiaceae bacterium]|nr:alpha/beta fold hydrolase [Cryptosporangiaceae bacterium]